MPPGRERLHLLCDNRDKQTLAPAHGQETAREGLGCSQGRSEEVGCLSLPLEARCDEEEVFPKKHLSTGTDGFESKDKHLRAHSREVTAAPEPHAMTSRRRGCCFLREDRVVSPVWSHQLPEPAPGWAERSRPWDRPGRSILH